MSPLQTAYSQYVQKKDMEKFPMFNVLQGIKHIPTSHSHRDSTTVW